MTVPVVSSEILVRILAIYNGSDGDATIALYKELEALGPIGVIAMNVLRAQKNSARAKVYRGRRFKDAAYGRKQWAMDKLTAALTEHAANLGFRWGWQEDPQQEFHRWVLYIDLPTSQVSFHTAARGIGPNYAGKWDGIREAGPGRTCRFVAAILPEEGLS